MSLVMMCHVMSLVMMCSGNGIYSIFAGQDFVLFV